MSRKLQHVLWVVVLIFGIPLNALAIPGEGWLGGENILLSKMVAAHLQEITQLTTIINNTRETVGAVNESLALARVARRTYEMLVHYSIADLEHEARLGLLSQFPELEALEAEISMAADNVDAFGDGEDAFFRHQDPHDYQMQQVARRMFEHSYRSTIWPMAFPKALKFHASPSQAELLVQQHFINSGDAKRRAVQQTALAVLANKVKAFVDDSESKNDLALRTATTQTQIAFQTMQNSTDLRDFKHAEVAQEEKRRQQDAKVTDQLGQALAADAHALVTLRSPLFATDANALTTVRSAW